MACGVVILVEAAASLKFRTQCSQHHDLSSHACTRCKAERTALIADPGVQHHIRLVSEFGGQTTCDRNHTPANTADRLDGSQAFPGRAAVADGNDYIASHDLTEASMEQFGRVQKTGGSTGR